MWFVVSHMLSIDEPSMLCTHQREHSRRIHVMNGLTHAGCKQHEINGTPVLCCCHGHMHGLIMCCYSIMCAALPCSLAAVPHAAACHKQPGCKQHAAALPPIPEQPPTQLVCSQTTNSTVVQPPTKALIITSSHHHHHQSSHHHRLQQLKVQAALHVPAACTHSALHVPSALQRAAGATAVPGLSGFCAQLHPPARQGPRHPPCALLPAGPAAAGTP
jgi:hypothetical protein